MRTISLLLLGLAYTCLALPSIENFPGRSADVIVEMNDKLTQDSALYLKGDYFSTSTLTSLDDTQFADLFSHVMGTPSFHSDAKREGFPSSSPFNKPKAALIVAIDSIGSELLSKTPISFIKGAKSASISSDSFPPNSHSLLATLATGALPSSHGIVGPSWRSASSGELISAYSPHGLSFSSSIADIFAQEWDGKALVLSASASPSLAHSLALHPELVKERGWDGHAYGLVSTLEGRKMTSSYGVGYSGNDFMLSVEDLEDISVKIDGEVVTFKASEDLALVAELAFVRNLIVKLRVHELVKDNVPDMYSIVFSSLKEIRHKYGKDSAAFFGALSLIDSAASDLLSTLNSLYSDQVASALIALRPRFAKCGESVSKSVKQAMYERVGRLLYDVEDFDAQYPAVYVRKSELPPYAREMLCQHLQESVGKDATIHCPVAEIHDYVSRGFFAVDDNTTNGNATTNPYAESDSDTVWAFWLNFWVALIIALFVGWGAYCLAYVGIDAGKDSLLFRATGRNHHN